MGRFIDRTSLRYGRLVVLRRFESGPASGGKRVRWICACDCGAETVVTGHALQRGETKSCGCYQRESTGDRHRKHGASRSPTHNSWRAMKARCLDPANEKYPAYGGSGVRVCSRWMEYENFAADMGDRPPKTTLDRIDPSGDYQPSNCRWASAKTQSENRRGIGHLWKGRIRTIADIARLENLPRTSLQKRVRHYGDPIEIAVRRLRSVPR